MGISGSQPALMQNRAGIARAGATRAGYFTPNIVTLIAGVDRSAYIEADSLRLGLRLNDRPDTASFTLEPDVPVIPVVNQLVRVGLGTAVNGVFTGQVSRVKHRRRFGNETPWVDVDCIDWTRLFDRRRITTEYGSQSATTTAVRIVQDWTSGFTTTNIQAGLPTVSFFPLTNEKPSSALRRLVALMGGGGFYLDEDRDVHLFGTAGETGARAPTAPLPLTNSLESLQVFTHEYDNTQQRTRVIAEGQRTACPIAVPVGAITIPVIVPEMFTASGGLARVGTQRITYTQRLLSNLDSTDSNATGTTVITAAAAGAAIVQVSSASLAFYDDDSARLTNFWVQIGDQVVFVNTSDIINNWLYVPTSGYGSLAHEVAVGQSVRVLGTLSGIPASGAGSVQIAQPADIDVVLYVQVDDTAAQTALAAIEGGDGIHEHAVRDGRLVTAGATARALAELALSEALLKAKWETEDLNARPGASQVINLTTNDPLSVTLTITDVDLRFPIPNYRPLRSCQASRVRLAGLVDVIGEDA